MTKDRWEQINKLYRAALKVADTERTSFLEHACAEDAAIRSEVESLLEAHAQAGNFLGEPAMEAMARKLSRDKRVFETGRQLEPYQILHSLGVGGMGVVYRARDTRLDRMDALKILPAEVAADPERLRRFVRGAKAASALNHPNIATIYEIGESDGIHWIAMELVEGQTLAKRMKQNRLEIGEILDIGIQAAEALAEAHSRGIVHRDIKPANLMLTSKGGVKVLDFGLAKQTHLERSVAGEGTVTESQTQPGVIIGTLPYMAPEQLLSQPVDGRSDLWALGVVLYEMTTGERPFQGHTQFELSSAILNQPPRPLPAKVPTELRALIERCLEKDPDRRYLRAGEVRAALEAIQEGTVAPWVAWRYRLARRAWLTLTATVLILLLMAGALGFDWLRTRWAGGVPRIRSLAVLPLENLSGDPQQEYFADGMTEELITNLAKIGALKVIARSSVMQYKDTRKPASEIAKELKVDGLIEGSVLREGGQVRITAQLIQASTDQHLWAESYQRDMRGVLALQGEIARAIAEKVRAVVTPTEHSRLASARTVNPEAYDAYLKGMQHWYKLTPQDLDIALEYFELALKKDPNYASAYAGVAMVWRGRNQMGYTAPHEAGPKARAAALKAVELDNTLAEAHSSLAGSNCYDKWDWTGADVEYKRAIELNPNYPVASASYSFYLMIMKRREEAMAQIQRALELDPFNAFFQAFHAVNLECAGRYDEAIVEFRKALRTSPELPFAHWMLSGTLFQKGLYEESFAEVKAYYAGDREIEEALTQGYAQSGYRGAMKRAADIWAARAPKTYTLPSDVAMLYVWAGEKDLALEWLEEGFEMRDPNMPVANVDPTFDPLRSDPRFQDLLHRMNMPQ